MHPHVALPLSRKQLQFAEGSTLPHTQGHCQALDGAGLGPETHPSACSGARPWPVGGHGGGDKVQISGFSLPGLRYPAPKGHRERRAEAVGLLAVLGLSRPEVMRLQQAGTGEMGLELREERLPAGGYPASVQALAACPKCAVTVLQRAPPCSPWVRGRPSVSPPSTCPLPAPCGPGQVIGPWSQLLHPCGGDSGTGLMGLPRGPKAMV